MEPDLTEIKKIEELVYSFFCESSDFNGIGLRSISQKLGLDYEDSIDKVKELVKAGVVDIQSSINPHIIGFTHHAIELQLEILEHAKGIGVTKKTIGSIEFVSENTEFPICVYPTRKYLE